MGHMAACTRRESPVVGTDNRQRERLEEAFLELGGSLFPITAGANREPSALGAAGTALDAFTQQGRQTVLVGLPMDS